VIVPTSVLSTPYGFLRMAVGAKAFVDDPISLDAARAVIEKGMQNREAAFLRKLEGAVWTNPRSPYLQLFRAAGCTPGDVDDLVKREGVEGALQQLLRAGIYVTLEEFKGRAPAVRGSQTFTFRDADFDNPRITTHLQSSSSGTRGRPTRIRVDLDHIAQSAPHWAMWFAAHGWLERPLVFWTPQHAGVANSLLMCAKFSKPVDRWFTTVKMPTMRSRLVAAGVHRVLRHVGAAPRPEFVPAAEASRIGEYLVGMLREGARPCVNTAPSDAIAVCLAMQARGLSLTNVTFLLRAEPVTKARRDAIEASGARAVPTYGFSEGGSVGSQCPNPAEPDDIHVSLDAYAVIPRSRPVGDGASVDALLLTALRPACPKILLNTEIGDHAVLETRQCGCLFDELGYVQHLHTIRSFEKLTGLGVTFLAGDLFHLLEEVLPGRFGGTVGDYQLVEAQDDRGLPHYTLRISPEVGPLDEAAVVAGFLDELGQLRSHYRFMADLWARAEVLHVMRSRPEPTARGKVLPFRALGPA
jgi:hypothetical protein